jgi:hypothetical protein
MNLPADFNDDGPTAADLAAIEAEWPLIEAELGVLDAEIAAFGAARGPSPLDWRRLRRARRRLLAELGHRAAVDDGPVFEAVDEWQRYAPRDGAA